MANIALLTSGRVGRQLAYSLRQHPNIFPIVDKSFSRDNLLKVMRFRSVEKKILFRIFIYELFHLLVKNRSLPKGTPVVKNNLQLYDFVHRNNVSFIVLFNANLIINPNIFDSNVNLFNIHCVNPSKYPGLGGIEKAIENVDLYQFAALHQVTSIIDGGSIIMTHPYELKLSKSHMANRDVAFRAGAQLFHIWYSGLNQ